MSRYARDDKQGNVVIISDLRQFFGVNSFFLFMCS